MEGLSANGMNNGLSYLPALKVPKCSPIFIKKMARGSGSPNYTGQYCSFLSQITATYARLNSFMSPPFTQQNVWSPKGQRGPIFVAVKPSLGILCVSFKEVFGGERVVSDKYILTLTCSELPTEQIPISV